MTSSKAVTVLAVTLSIAAVMMPELAFAQAGSGQAAGLISWLVTNLGKPLLYAGIIMIAFLLFGGRISMTTVACVAGGGLVLANYGAIASFFKF